MEERVFNFSSGPSQLPLPVLEKAQKELVSYGGTGMSVMEMSHRSKPIIGIADETVALLREVMNIPDNYKVLFIQGGATLQFAMVPMNLMKNKKADFVMTGYWAKKAADQSKAYGTVRVAATDEANGYKNIPRLDKSMVDPQADFVHITSNNTIYGTRFTEIPDTGDVPLVADASSHILSEPLDVSKFGIIYAGAQKNMGPAGMATVIIREDLIGTPIEGTPVYLNYKTHADAESMYNTPPVYCIYICKLVLEWLKNLGGIPAMQKINEEKAKLLYDQIDNSKIFRNEVAVKDRSLMNVIFVTGNPDLDKKFVDEAKKAGLITLNGHKAVGGLRASLYNAMPVEGVKALVEFMKKFEMENK